MLSSERETSQLPKTETRKLGIQTSPYLWVVVQRPWTQAARSQTHWFSTYPQESPAAQGQSSKEQTRQSVTKGREGIQSRAKGYRNHDIWLIELQGICPYCYNILREKQIWSSKSILWKGVRCVSMASRYWTKLLDGKTSERLEILWTFSEFPIEVTVYDSGWEHLCNLILRYLGSLYQ